MKPKMIIYLLHQRSAQVGQGLLKLLWTKEIGDKEPCYSTKILIFFFIWAGLAALHKASTMTRFIYAFSISLSSTSYTLER